MVSCVYRVCVYTDPMHYSAQDTHCMPYNNTLYCVYDILQYYATYCDIVQYNISEAFTCLHSSLRTFVIPTRLPAFYQFCKQRSTTHWTYTAGSIHISSIFRMLVYPLHPRHPGYYYTSYITCGRFMRGWRVQMGGVSYN